MLRTERVHHRRGGPPLRHEGLVHPGLRRLHAAPRAVALARFGHQRASASPGSASTPSEDFFLFLHFWDAHIPYLPPSPFKERFSHRTAGRIDPLITEKLEGRPSYPLFKKNLYDFLDAMPNLDFIADLYDAEVAYLDFEINRIFEHLGERGLLEDTMVVLFGDHGENMTEHDAWFDHAGLYDSVVHVPLILWAPGQIPVAESSAMVTLVDVLPPSWRCSGCPRPRASTGARCSRWPGARWRPTGTR